MTEALSTQAVHIANYSSNVGESNQRAIKQRSSMKFSYSEILARVANITPQDREKYAQSAQRVGQHYDNHPVSKGRVAVDTLPWDLFPIPDKQDPMVITLAAATETAVILCTTFEIWSNSVTNTDEWRLTERVVAMGKICLILRAMDERIFLQNFITVGKTDISLPFTRSELESILEDEAVCEKFFTQQYSATVRDIPPGIHRSFCGDEIVPLRHLRNLGKGAFGSVDCVADIFTGEVYARKVFRSRRKVARTTFETEISTLRRLQSHHHIVQLVASYVHANEMALLLLPVADSNLHDLLLTSKASKDRTGTCRTLYRCFGCLASGLAFMHSQQIRHKDIKPQNILVHQSNVLLTDFGLAFDFSDDGVSTTYGQPEFWTRRYCAPEVTMHGRRGRKSDVFSLGRVLLEVATVLCGKSLEDFEDFLSDEGLFGQNPTEALRWIGMLEKSCNDAAVTIPLRICRQMLQAKAADRPYMEDVLGSLVKGDYMPNAPGDYFCDSCLKQPGLGDIPGRAVVGRSDAVEEGKAEMTLSGPTEKSNTPPKDGSTTLDHGPQVEDPIATQGNATRTIPQMSQPPTIGNSMVIDQPLAPPITPTPPPPQEQEQRRLFGEKDVVKSKQLITFKDALGRKFSFPFQQCRTWEGMELLILQAFLHLNTLRPQVRQRHYDLVGPDGIIIVPSSWESVIKPDWTIRMILWPVAMQSCPAPTPPPPPAIMVSPKGSPPFIETMIPPPPPAIMVSPKGSPSFIETMIPPPPPAIMVSTNGAPPFIETMIPTEPPAPLTNAPLQAQPPPKLPPLLMWTAGRSAKSKKGKPS